MTTSDPMMKRASASFLPPIALDNNSPMYRQLYDWFRTAILEGQLKPGRRVPSTRSLAAELKVSRITVLSAFEQLYAEGYLETLVGSGTYVSRSIPDDLVTLRKLAPRDRRPEGGQPPRHLTQRSGSRKVSRFGMALLSAPPEPWSNRLGPFSVGMPALDHFPFAVWSRLVIRHSRQPANELLAYSDPTGHPPFEIVAAKAGMHLIIRLPAKVDDVAVSQRASREGIAVMPLSICYHEKPRRGGLILGYGGTDQQQIREGTRKLASVLRPIGGSR